MENKKISKFVLKRLPGYLFYSCNTGDASVSLLSIGNQNDKAGNDGVTPSEAGVARFNELAASCKGFKWVRNARLGYNLDVGYALLSCVFSP